MSDKTVIDHLGALYARAWQDDVFKALLESNPSQAIKRFAKEQGIKAKDLELPKGAKVGSLDPEASCYPPCCC